MANQLCRNSQRSPEPTWKKGEGNSAFNRPRWTGKYEAGSERKAALCMSDTSSLHPLNRRSRLLTKYSASALVPRFTGISYPVKHGLVPPPKSRSRNLALIKKGNRKCRHGPENAATKNSTGSQRARRRGFDGRNNELFLPFPVAPRLPIVVNFFLAGLARLMTEELRATRS